MLLQDKQRNVYEILKTEEIDMRSICVCSSMESKNRVENYIRL